MAIKFFDLVGQAGTYSTTGPKVDLDGSAKADHQTFSAAGVSNTDTVYVLIKKNTTNLLVWEATFNDLATDNVTRVTELDAIGSISNSDAVDVYLVNPATLIKRSFEQSQYFISGIVPSWTDADTIAWSAGQAVVDGELLDYAAANTGNLATTDPGRSAAGVWYHYLYNNAGTPTVELSQTAPVDGGDGLYFHKSADTSRRFIGYHHTWNNGGNNDIVGFWVSGNKNRLDWHYYFQLPNRVSTTTSTTMVATDCSAVIPSTVVCDRAGFAIKLQGDDGEDLAGFVHPNNPPAKSSSALGVRATYGRSSAAGYTFFGHTYINIESTTVYVGVSNNSGTINASIFDVVGATINR